MSIADELARERAAARRAEQDRRRDVSRSRGIDDVDSLDELDVLDWSTDPWDEAVAAGSVERLRWQTRSIKWVAYTLLVLVMVAVLVAGAVGWWYIHQVNPAGRPGHRRSRSRSSRADTLQTVSDRLQQQGFVEDAGLFRWYADHHGGLELTPGYYELRTSDHMGNVLARLRTPPSETYTKVTFPEGFTLAQIAERLDRDMPTMTAADVLAAAGRSEPGGQPAPARASRRSKGCCSPTPTRCPTARRRATCSGRMIGQMERVVGQENIDDQGAEVRA